MDRYLLDISSVCMNVLYFDWSQPALDDISSALLPPAADHEWFYGFITTCNLQVAQFLNVISDECPQAPGHYAAADVPT